jgi:hypothetical protein
MDYKEMKEKIQNLETEIQSNISNPEYREMFTKVYDKLRYQTLMTVTSDGEA